MADPQYMPFSQPQTPYGAGIANLAQAMFGGPTRLKQLADQALVDYRNAEAEKARVETDALGRAARGAQGLAGVFASMPRLLAAQHAGGAGRDPGAIDSPDSLADAMGAEFAGRQAGGALQAIPAQMAAYSVLGGKDTMSNVADLFNFTLANTEGVGDAAVYRSLAGAGKPMGADQSVSLAGQDAIRAANAQNDRNKAIAVEKAKPLTYDQVRGQTLADFLAAQPGARNVGAIVGAYNKPKWVAGTDANGNTVLFDENASLPQGVGLPRTVVTGPDGTSTTTATDLVNLLGTADPNKMPASREALEAEAASLGLTVAELDYKKMFESAMSAAGPLGAGISPILADATAKATYAAIIAKAQRAAAGAGAPPPPPGSTNIRPPLTGR